MLAQHTANCWVSASSPLSYFLLCVPNFDKHLGGGEKGTFDQSLEYILSRAPRCCCWEQRREWRIQEAVAGARTYLPHGFSPDGSQNSPEQKHKRPCTGAASVPIPALLPAALWRHVPEETSYSREGRWKEQGLSDGNFPPRTSMATGLALVAAIFLNQASLVQIHLPNYTCCKNLAHTSQVHEKGSNSS